MTFDESKHYVLGIVERIGSNRDSYGNQVVFVKPLCWSDGSSPGWVDIFTDDQRYDFFPEEGNLIWFDKLDKAKDNFLYSFMVIETPENRNRVCQWQVKPETVKGVVEILDLWSTLKHTDDIRVALLDHQCPVQTVASTVYARIDEQYVVGPLKTTDHNGEPVFDMTQDLHALPVHRMHNLGVFSTSVTIDGVKHILLGRDDKLLGTELKQDWSCDADVIHAALKYIAKNDSKLTDPRGGLHLTDARIRDSIAKHIQEGDDLNLNIQRLTRAKMLLDKLNSEDDLLTAVTEDILELPAVQQIIEAKALLEIENQSAQITDMQQKAEKEIADKQEAARQEIISLQKATVSETTIQREAAEEEIKSLRKKAAEIEQQSSDILNALQNKADDIIRQPLEAIADLLVARSLHITNEIQAQGTTCSVDEPLLVEAIGSDDLNDQMLCAADMYGIQPTIMKELHAALMANAFPIIKGDSVSKAVECFSSCISGGDFHWVPISPVMIDVKSVFGDGQSSALARAFIQAETNPDRLFLVYFDGVNKAPIDSYLLPLLTSYQSRCNNNRLYRLEIPGPTGYIQMRRWPRNLLAVGSYDEGVLALPVSEAAWQRVVPIRMSELGIGLQPGGLIQEDATCMMCSDWYQWCQQITFHPNSIDDDTPPLWTSYRTAHLQLYGVQPPIPARFEGHTAVNDELNLTMQGITNGI